MWQSHTALAASLPCIRRRPLSVSPYPRRRTLMAVEPKDSPGVGVDEWVARSVERKEYPPGWRGDAQRALERVGWWPRLGLAAAFGVFIPLVIGLNSFQTQVGIDALLLAILALGLNVSVGWAGLLDL